MPFDPERFALQMLTEVLFFDEDSGMHATVALLDEEHKERYLGIYDPTEDKFAVEEATAWERVDSDDDGQPDLSVASDGKTYGEYETVEEAARALYDLARKHDLTPSVAFFSEEPDEDGEDDEEGEDAPSDDET